MKFLNFLLIFIKLTSCITYIDFKDFKISEGLIVYQGYLGELKNQYFMFIGKRSPIDEVRFGNQVIFQYIHDPLIKYNVYVEYFHYAVRFVVIHIFSKNQLNQEEFNVIRYEIEDDEINYAAVHPSSLVYCKIRLSVDICETSSKHPFIKLTEQYFHDYREVNYTVLEKFGNLKLDGYSGPKYGIGHIYDSKARAMIGYLFHEDLFNQCRTLKIQYRNAMIKAIIFHNSELEYVKELIDGGLYWTYSGFISNLRNTGRRKGLAAKLRVESVLKLRGKILLDLAEYVSPEKYKIEKLTGTLANFEYIRYEPTDENKPIKFIIDARLQTITVYVRMGFHVIRSVEIYKNDQKFIVVINYDFTIDGTKIKDSIVLDKKKNKSKYQTLDNKTKELCLNEYKSLYPIYLNIDIYKDPISVYQIINVTDDMYRFRHFKINEFDNSEQEILSKYQFGTIHEVKPYTLGNIPSESFKTEKRIIRDFINSNEFLIRNPYIKRPINVSEYEIYVPIQ